MAEEKLSEFSSKRVPAQGDVATTGEVVKWDYGHLIIQCYRCGHKKILDTDVEGGVNLFLPVAENKQLKLTCEKCNTAISMYFIKSDKVKPPKEPDSTPAGELVVEEKKTKRKKNESSKGRKKKKPVSTDSKDS